MGCSSPKRKGNASDHAELSCVSKLTCDDQQALAGFHQKSQHDTKQKMKENDTGHSEKAALPST